LRTPQGSGDEEGRHRQAAQPAGDARGRRAPAAGKSQKDALRAAGYSESTIETQAHRFFNRPKIVAEIVRIMGPAMKAPEVLIRLSRKARTSADEAIEMDALKTLAKHHKLLTDKTEVTGKDGGPLEFTVKEV
jgi:hypothetical protein